MRTREEYYDLVLENRRLASDPAVTRCTCPNALCDWHGKCKECVALHRHHGDHLPFCLQPMVRDKVQALAGVVEMTAAPKDGTPLEYRHYVKERDKQRERRKYIGRVDKSRIQSYQSKVIRVNEGNIQGYAALVRIEKVHHPVIFGDTLLYDDGYCEINFLPDGAHWALSAIYDGSGDIVEWYFDMVRKNAVDEDGNPYCDDLYLDAALMPDGQIRIFDEDEIQDALNAGKITRYEFDMAYATLRELKQNGILDLAYMKTLCARLRALFS